MLLGSGHLPFHVRLNLTYTRAAATAAWLGLGIVAFVLLRVPSLQSILTLDILLLVLDIAWRRRCRSAPDGGSHARLRELIPLAFMLIQSTLGTRARTVRGWLDRVQASASGPAPGGARTLRHALLLLLASRCLSSALMWCFPVRLSLALPAHLLMSTAVLTNNVDTCSSALLASPAAHQLTQRVSGVLGMLRFGSFALGPGRGAPSADEECRAVLAYLQLSLGFAVPAILQAVLEARLFRQHGKDRRRAALPQEAGLQARFYALLADVLLDLDWLSALALSWTLLGVLHLLATAVSTG